MSIYSPRYEIITERTNPLWWQLLLAFVAGMFVVVFLQALYQICSYEEPVVNMATIKVEQLDRNGDVVAKYFGTDLFYAFNKDMDEYIIKRFNGDVVIPARDHVILTPYRIKGE